MIVPLLLVNEEGGADVTPAPKLNVGPDVDVKPVAIEKLGAGVELRMLARLGVGATAVVVAAV